MLQVTTDLETTLYQREQAMSRLIKWRETLVREAERMVANANREFDQVAVPLGREINDLRARLHKQTDESVKMAEPPRRAPRKTAALAGLDDDERQHFLQLQARKAKR